MYRALSPSAEANTDMDVSTPKGTGGRSPPPAAASTRLNRPPGAALLAQASLPAGVRTADVHRTAENAAVSGPGGEAPDTARGGQPEPRPPRANVLTLLRTGPPSRRSRSRVPHLD
eukprot:1307218-Amphidinium_carterae.1